VYSWLKKKFEEQGILDNAMTPQHEKSINKKEAAAATSLILLFITLR
jgi:hypothetical protein